MVRLKTSAYRFHRCTEIRLRIPMPSFVRHRIIITSAVAVGRVGVPRYVTYHTGTIELLKFRQLIELFRTANGFVITDRDRIFPWDPNTVSSPDFTVPGEGEVLCIGRQHGEKTPSLMPIDLWIYLKCRVFLVRGTSGDIVLFTRPLMERRARGVTLCPKES